MRREVASRRGEQLKAMGSGSAQIVVGTPPPSLVDLVFSPTKAMGSLGPARLLRGGLGQWEASGDWDAGRFRRLLGTPLFIVVWV